MADPKQLIGAGGLEVSVVTPRGEVSHGSVNAITARGALGELEVLPGHIPFITILETGVLILGEGPNSSVYAVGPGYLEVSADGSCDVLVERATPADQVDAAEARADLEAVDHDMKSLDKTDDVEWKNLSARRAWALARLEAMDR